MGCLSLTYQEQRGSFQIIYKNDAPEALEEKSYFFQGVLEKRGHAEKKGANSYRYGFNGMEKDDELKGSGNSYDFGARIYDSRLGKWLSIDRMAYKKPYLTPYQGFKNNPIIYIDPDGNDEWLFYEDGSWEFNRSGPGEPSIGPNGLFVLVDENGVKENIHSTANWLLGMLPFVDNPDEDVSDELASRPIATLLFRQEYGLEHTAQMKALQFYKNAMIPVDIASLVFSLPSLIKASVKGGKFIIDVIKHGKTLAGGIVSSSGSIKFGNITYKSVKALKEITAKEIDFLSYADKLGEAFTVLGRGADKTADFSKAGKTWELKTIEDILTTSADFTNNIKKAILRGVDQSSNIIADMRNLDVSYKQALEAANRAFGSSDKVQEIRIIGDGFDEIIKRAN